MTSLSVNINKIATIRNARGGQEPDVVKAAVAIQNFGAHGITVHPRPDERHITRKDAYALRGVVHTEYNIEGYPSEDFSEDGGGDQTRTGHPGSGWAGCIDQQCRLGLHSTRRPIERNH